jgi:hypothetical protein
VEHGAEGRTGAKRAAASAAATGMFSNSNVMALTDCANFAIAS